jgi:hypothetical protein
MIAPIHPSAAGLMFRFEGKRSTPSSRTLGILQNVLCDDGSTRHAELS